MSNRHNVPQQSRERKVPADISLWMLFPLFFAAVYLSHITLLRLPYFWDEARYYIPTAWDFYRTGSLIPQTTLTNAHPPLPSILLAAWWHLSGYVVSGTRTLVCMIAAASLLGVFVGIGLRLQTFLWLGLTTFVLDVVYEMGRVSVDYAMAKWAIMLALGITLVLFVALNEKKRILSQMLDYYAQVRTWE